MCQNKKKHVWGVQHVQHMQKSLFFSSFNMQMYDDLIAVVIA